MGGLFTTSVVRRSEGMALYTTIVVRVNSTNKLFAEYVFHLTKSTDHNGHFQLERRKIETVEVEEIQILLLELHPKPGLEINECRRKVNHNSFCIEAGPGNQ
jgi:hypothetical protein